jgi:hypothetical protein
MNKLLSKSCLLGYSQWKYANLLTVAFTDNIFKIVFHYFQQQCKDNLIGKNTFSTILPGKLDIIKKNIHKNKFKFDQISNIRAKNIKLLKENGYSFHDIGVGNSFLDVPQITSNKGNK